MSFSFVERTFEGQMVALSIGQLRNGSGGPTLNWSILHDDPNPNSFHKSLHSLLARLLNQHNWNRASTAQQIYQFFVDDLRSKFELVFNRSEFADCFKRVEIANLRRLRPTVNRDVNQNANRSTDQSVNSHRYDRLVHSVKQLDNRLVVSNQSDASSLLADLTAITSSITSPGELLERLADYLPAGRLLIEFRVLFSSTDLDLELSASSVYLAISSELIKLNEGLFGSYNLDQSSLSIKEVYPEDRLDATIQQLLRLVLNNSSILHNRRLKRLQLIKLNRLNRTTVAANLDELDYLQVDNRTESEDRNSIRCEERKLSFCQFLPYSSVMYPNGAGHHGLEELQSELIYFRQIMDSECFHLAREFICLLLQPACPLTDDRPVLPCGQLCEQFISSCSPYIPGQLRDRLYSCEQFGKLQDAIALFRDKNADRNGRKDERNDKSRSYSGDLRGDVEVEASKSNGMRKMGGGRTDFDEDSSGQRIGKTMESRLIVGRDNEQTDGHKDDANHNSNNRPNGPDNNLDNRSDNNANDGKQIRSISLADETSDVHHTPAAPNETGGQSNLVNSIELARETVRRESTAEEGSERSNAVKAVRTTEERPQARARRQSLVQPTAEWKIELDDKNNLADSKDTSDIKEAKDTNSDDKMPNASRPSDTTADRSSSGVNNRQIGSNCFNLEDLAQLTLSARV